MPMLKKEPFLKQEPPSDLSPDEDVFYCKITDEIFRDYELFFERTILCNSILWSCSLTGRSGLTFQEALESEERARKVLASFPKLLKRPLLFLACLTHRTRLADINDDVFMYAKDRYFINEQIEVTINKMRKSGKVEAVIAPKGRSPAKNGDLSDSDSDSVPLIKKAALKPSLYKYVISEKGKTETITVGANQVSRKKGLYTRDKSKLFLKQNCEFKDGNWKVKDPIIKQHKLLDAKFLDFFSGTAPMFQRTVVKAKTTPPQKQKAGASKVTDQHRQLTKTEKVMPEATKITEIPKISAEDIARMREEDAEMRRQQKEEMRKRIEEDKVRRKEERDREREKKREEKRLQEEYMREWRRPRDDLECDDLKLLPEPVVFKTSLPPELFGEAIMVLEFLHSFSTVFDLHDHFPNGVSWEMLERGLMEKDINSPLADILKFLLQAIFNLEGVEEEEELELASDHAPTMDTPDMVGYDSQMSHLIQTATIMSQVPQQCFGTSLRNLQIDASTITEVLRLHIVRSGARVTQRNVKFRYQQRGGYTSLDDAGLELKHRHPELVKALACTIVFDLMPGDKLKLMTALTNQFLTYAATRDYMEDSYDKAKRTRLELRQSQCAEERREKDVLIARYKKKMEDREREKAEHIQAIMAANDVMRQSMPKNEDGTTPETTPAPVPIPMVHVNPPPKVLRNLDPEIMDLLSKNTGDQKRNSRKKVAATTESLLEIIVKIDEDDLVAEDRSFFLERKLELEARYKSELDEKERQLSEEIMRAAMANAVISLGRDRMYRRYWTFQSLPGLFIETEDHPLPEGVLRAAPQKLPSAAKFDVDDIPLKVFCKNAAKVNGVVINGSDKNSSDKENESTNAATFPVLPAFDKDDINADVMIISATCRDAEKPVVADPVVAADPVVEQIAATRTAWGYLESADKLEQLIGALNVRGSRENGLKVSLLENRRHVGERIEACAGRTVVEPARREGDGGMSSEQQMELNVRDMLLDIEERIFIGALGKLKIKDRNVWRDAIERGGYDPQSADPSFDRMVPDTHDDRASNCSEEQQATIHDLACALLQIEQGTERRFIAKPLGTGEHSSRSRKPRPHPKDDADSPGGGDDDSTAKPHKGLQDRWEESLLLVTNLSQVSLYLATLERHIMWAKSALHARCRICRRKGDAEHMLLCDGCDRGHHTYCLKPPVKHIPTGDWFCTDCKPRDVYRTPMKGRRKTFSEEESEGEVEASEGESDEVMDSSVAALSEEEQGDDEEEGDESMADEENEVEEDDYHESSCSVCGQGGILICCDHCPLSYHLACNDPPLKKIPKGEWMCASCRPANNGKTNMVKIKVSAAKSKRLSSTKSTPASSQTNSRYNSPANTRPSSRCGGGRKRGAGSDSDPETPVSSRRQSKTSRFSIENNEDELGRHHGKQYASSSRGTSNAVSMKMVEEVIQELVKDDEALPFLKPVSKRLVPDYHEIITSPMDFQTIRNKINRFEYDDYPQMATDVRLIFTNCMRYNKTNTGIYRAGARLLKLFDKRVGELSLGAADDCSPAGPSKRSRRH